MDGETAKPKKAFPWIIAGIAGCGCLILVGSILAAIAVPAFINYVKRSKAAEARGQLQVLETQWTSQCVAGSATSLVAGPLPVTPTDQLQSPNWAADPGFTSLGFSPSVPVYYSYRVTPDGTGGATLTASGDLDADGVRSTHEVRCDARCACTSMPPSMELE